MKSGFNLDADVFLPEPNGLYFATERENDLYCKGIDVPAACRERCYPLRLSFVMATSGLLRHQIIEHQIAPHTEKFAEDAITQWEQLAAQIISIVGEGGFNALYARSVFLAQSSFPCLAARVSPARTNDRFAELRMSLGELPSG